MNPLVSVIIPAHNSEKTIGTAITSIIDQTWKNLEIIIIDDNSTDETETAVLEYLKKDNRVSYYKLPFDDPHRVNNRGRNINAGYMARNYGFEKVRGELITFQDADDASFLNRIEVQYELLKKHNAIHMTLDWQQFKQELIGKKFNLEKYITDRGLQITTPKEICAIARKAKGMIIPFLGKINSKIDFEIKRARIINRLFFGTLEGYPGTGNSPLFMREVIDKVKFRQVNDRIWPSFTGRGADRDFNFQVAETFEKSYVVKIPLYMWRVNRQNPGYENIGAYCID